MNRFNVLVMIIVLLVATGCVIVIKDKGTMGLDSDKTGVMVRPVNSEEDSDGKVTR